MMNEKKELPELDGFNGTQAYHKFNLMTNMVATDGMIYLANKVGCFWLLEVVASVQSKPKVRMNNHFIIWRIEVRRNEGIVSGYTDCEEDGSYSASKQVYSQKIPYTDFPEGTFEFYQEGGVLLLKSEH